MTGVFGVVDQGEGANLDGLVSRIADKLRLRPWSKTATSVFSAGGFRIGRIGIGAELGEALRRSEDGKIEVALCGRLWDGDALRREIEASGLPLRDRSQEELVLRLYQIGGSDFVRRLNGEFVLCIWDGVGEELVLANDPLGMYPTYWARAGARLAFAPSLRGVLAALPAKPELDLTALAQYVRFQSLLGERTFFEDVRQLPAGTVLRYRPRERRVVLDRYWSAARIRRGSRPSVIEATELIGRSLDLAVRRRTGRVNALFLTGGLDSRLLLALLKGTKATVEAVTYGCGDSRDVVYAQRVARATSTAHRWFPIADGRWVANHAALHLATTEGLHPWIHGHAISVLPQLRDAADVLFTGWGGGTVVGGWLNYFRLPPAICEEPDVLAATLFRWFTAILTWPGVEEAEESILYHPSLSASLRGRAFDSMREELAPYMECPADLRAEMFYVFNHDFRMLQPWITMLRSHLEVASPYFDFDLFRTVYSMPAELRGYRYILRTLLHAAEPRLSLIPYDRDGLLPTVTTSAVYTLHKWWSKSTRKFNAHVARVFPEPRTLALDYEHWLRTDLRDWGRESLLGERTLARRLFEPRVLRSLWEQMQTGATPNFIGKLAPLMTYEMMLRYLLDES